MYIFPKQESAKMEETFKAIHEDSSFADQLCQLE